MLHTRGVETSLPIALIVVRGVRRIARATFRSEVIGDDRETFARRVLREHLRHRRTVMYRIVVRHVGAHGSHPGGFVDDAHAHGIGARNTRVDVVVRESSQRTIEAAHDIGQRIDVVSLRVLCILQFRHADDIGIQLDQRLIQLGLLPRQFLCGLGTAALLLVPDGAADRLIVVERQEVIQDVHPDHLQSSIHVGRRRRSRIRGLEDRYPAAKRIDWPQTVRVAAG